jgi:hypothetical protein
MEVQDMTDHDCVRTIIEAIEGEDPNQPVGLLAVGLDDARVLAGLLLGLNVAGRRDVADLASALRRVDGSSVRIVSPYV